MKIRQRLVFGVAGIVAARKDFDPDWTVEYEHSVNDVGYEVHLSAENGNIDVWKQVTLRPDEFAQAIRFLEEWEARS